MGVAPSGSRFQLLCRWLIGLGCRCSRGTRRWRWCETCKMYSTKKVWNIWLYSTKKVWKNGMAIKNRLSLKGLRISMKPYVDQGWMENIPLYAAEAYFMAMVVGGWWMEKKVLPIAFPGRLHLGDAWRHRIGSLVVGWCRRLLRFSADTFGRLGWTSPGRWCWRCLSSAAIGSRCADGTCLATSCRWTLRVGWKIGWWTCLSGHHSRCRASRCLVSAWYECFLGVCCSYIRVAEDLRMERKVRSMRRTNHYRFR